MSYLTDISSDSNHAVTITTVNNDGFYSIIRLSAIEAWTLVQFIQEEIPNPVAAIEAAEREHSNRT